MKRFLLLALALTCLLLTAFPAQGSGESSSGYRVILDDGADLLTPDEEQRVLEAMTPLSRYGDVIFWTTLARSSNTSMLRLQQYVDVNISPSVDHPSASFFIDMSSRTFCILNRGELMRTVDSSEVNSIISQVRPYAKLGEYAECAVQAFNAIRNAHIGARSFSVIRWLCALLLSAGIGLIVSFRYIQRKSIQPIPSVRTLDFNVKKDIKSEVLSSKLEQQTKTKIQERSSSSSGSSCSSYSSCSSCSSCSSGSSCSSCGSGGSSSF